MSVFITRRLTTPAFVFLVACAMCFLPHVRTKLTAKSVECVFLGYSAEHKGYRCWDPVGRRMRTSRDVVFDESRPFYPRPSSDVSTTSLVDPLSFLTLLDSCIATTPLSRSVPSSMVPFSSPVAPLPTESSSEPPLPVESSSVPPLVAPDYTVKPPVTHVYT